MKLYIARHCWAGPSSKDPKRERDRPLLPQGKSIAAKMADALEELGEVPNVIFTSPFERAIQTADIYGKCFGVAVNIIGDLAPDRPLENFLADLLDHDHLTRIMLVGHVDNTTPLFKSSPSKDKWKPLVRGEVRRLKIDRDSLEWKLKFGIKPSDIGLSDHEDED